MSLKHSDVHTWDNDRLLAEYEQRLTMLETLGGWLYTSIVTDEVDVIAEVAKCRSASGIAQWRDHGFIPTTWTDLFHLVHDWASPCRSGVTPYPLPDKPMKLVTCLRCVVQAAPP